MKLLNCEGAPLPITADDLTGFVYAARGGQNCAERYWLVVSDNQMRRRIHLLSLDQQGEIVGSASYGRHAFEERVPIGRIIGALPCFDVEWFK
jgi:hypothetical protein